jgi:hypothetical protein
MPHRLAPPHFARSLNILSLELFVLHNTDTISFPPHRHSCYLWANIHAERVSVCGNPWDFDFTSLDVEHVRIHPRIYQRSLAQRSPGKRATCALRILWRWNVFATCSRGEFVCSVTACSSDSLQLTQSPRLTWEGCIWGGWHDDTEGHILLYFEWWEKCTVKGDDVAGYCRGPKLQTRKSGQFAVYYESDSQL